MRKVLILLILIGLILFPRPAKTALCVTEPDFCINVDGVTFCYVCNGNSCELVDVCPMPDPMPCDGSPYERGQSVPCE